MTDDEAFPAKLEHKIITAADQTQVNVRLSFLIAMQRHIMLLMNQLALAEEENIALRNDKGGGQ